MTQASAPNSMPLLPVAEPDLSDLERAYAREAVDSGWISSLGPFIERFEQAFAELTGAEHCVAVSNGTVAIHLALVAARVGPGDEVIVPDLTFAATAAAVHHAGATPVLVDVDRATWCLDPALVEAAITPRTKAIMPVHLFGHPAAMDQINALAKKHGIFVLEDAAEAHGARFAGQVVGSIGDAGCFSFYGNKLITTGEGGAVTTNDGALAKRLRFLKDHAMSADRRYFHPEVGFNYRMTNIQAAIGTAQIERFPAMLAKKQAVLATYREQFRALGTDVVLNPAVAPSEPVCWMVTALLPGAWDGERMREFMGRMRSNHGVDTRPFFVPMHELPPYAPSRLVRGATSVASDLAARGICLPSSTKLSAADIARVTEGVAAELKGSAA
jgi:perosamine synthetase